MATFILVVVSIALHATSGEVLLPLLGAFVSGVGATCSIRAMYVLKRDRATPRA